MLYHQHNLPHTCTCEKRYTDPGLSTSALAKCPDQPLVGEGFLHHPDLVVASDEHELGRGEQLLGQKVRHHLKAMLASVHIVPEEQELGRSQYRPHPPKNLLKTREVPKVAMDVT